MIKKTTKHVLRYPSTDERNLSPSRSKIIARGSKLINKTKEKVINTGKFTPTKKITQTLEKKKQPGKRKCDETTLTHRTHQIRTFFN